MSYIDQMLLAAIVASLLVNVTSIYLQKKWRFYSLFVGKKHAYKVYLALLVLLWLETVAVIVFIPVSKWRFTSLWFIGLPLIIYSIRLALQSIKNVGFRNITNAALFNTKHSQAYNVKARQKQLLYLSPVLLLVGLGLTLGRYGYFTGAGMLLACLSLLYYFERPSK